MLRLIYSLIKDFGTFGAVIAFGCTNLYFIWKLATNHLKHLQKAIEDNISETKCVKNVIIDLKERVAKIEGKIE